MKLLLITAVSEFEKEVKNILKKAQVKTYSYKEVTGFRDASDDAIESNWFGTEMNENESILFYAFVAKENVNIVCESVKEFNAKQETLSHIHIAILNIEKTN
jgi:nitrogen regulatory protein PII